MEKISISIFPIVSVDIIIIPVVSVVPVVGCSISVLPIHIFLELVSEGFVGVTPDVHLRECG